MTDAADWQMLTHLLMTRSGGRCEGCGRLFDGHKVKPSRHHRRPGRMGGRSGADHDNTANLLLICGDGTTGCHGWAESYRAEATARGWLLRDDQDPDTTPVLLRGRWVLLDRWGQYDPATAPQNV